MATKRQMPSAKKVAANWGLSLKECYRCERTNIIVERAHIIDRSGFPPGTPAEVTDALDNLVPLCRACHSEQPPFRPEDEDVAQAWLDGDYETYARWISLKMLEDEAIDLFRRPTEEDKFFRQALKKSREMYLKKSPSEREELISESVRVIGSYKRDQWRRGNGLEIS